MDMPLWKHLLYAAALVLVYRIGNVLGYYEGRRATLKDLINRIELRRAQKGP